jgi:hypothetical protein
LAGIASQVELGGSGGGEAFGKKKKSPSGVVEKTNVITVLVRVKSAKIKEKSGEGLFGQSSGFPESEKQTVLA